MADDATARGQGGRHLLRRRRKLRPLASRRSDRVDIDDLRANQRDFGRSVEKRDLAGEPLRPRDIVGVHARNERRPRLPQSVVEGVDKSRPRARQQTQPPVSGRQRRKRCEGAVARSVVDRQQFKVDERLAENAVDGVREIRASVAHGQNYGNHRRRGGVCWLFVLRSQVAWRRHDKRPPSEGCSSSRLGNPPLKRVITEMDPFDAPFRLIRHRASKSGLLALRGDGSTADCNAVVRTERTGDDRLSPKCRGRSSQRGGGGGIRTRDTVSRIHTFQACAFDRSATPPCRAVGARPAHITPCSASASRAACKHSRGREESGAWTAGRALR